MRKHGMTVLLVVLAVVAQERVSFAQSATDCSSLMRFGIYDKFQTFTEESQFRLVKSFFENNQFSTRQQAQKKAGDLGLDIDGVLDLKLNGKASSSSFEQWRQELVKSTYEQAASAGLKISVTEKISGKMTSLIEKCIGQKGLHAYVIPANDNRNFSITIDYVPSSSAKPTAKGSFVITPSSVATSCVPKSAFSPNLTIGPQGISVSCKRLPTETVTVTVTTDEGSPIIRYEAHVVPSPTVSFSAKDAVINSGQSTTLTWDVTNASKVSLGDGSTKAEVGLTGNRSVSPSKTTEYVLSVTSLDNKVSSTFARVEVRPPPPVLTGARVHFHTTDDDKDGDTTVFVGVKCSGNTIASVSGTFGKFPDNTDSGWKGLTVHEKRKKDDVFGQCQAVLIESPKGKDEWHFNWALELSFSDGTNKRYDWGGGNVDHDRTTITQPMP